MNNIYPQYYTNNILQTFFHWISFTDIYIITEYQPTTKKNIFYHIDILYIKF